MSCLISLLRFWKSILIFFLAVWVFSSCGTALFYNPSRNTSSEKVIKVEPIQPNPTKQADIYQVKTIKILGRNGKQITGQDNKVLFLEVARNQFLGETDFTARYIKFSSENDGDWVSSGKLTLPYSKLDTVYRSRHELIAVKAFICSTQGGPTYLPNGKYNYQKAAPVCPE
jgi:hypothetical protein